MKIQKIIIKKKKVNQKRNLTFQIYEDLMTSSL
nr:MAG TPA: hypothetical protein [Bacteriophage sp.]